jgi:glutamyl-tRNA reductase
VSGGRAQLVMLGVSHRNAPVAARERLHLAPQRARELCDGLAACGGEAVVFSTCNRTEIYLAGGDLEEAQARARAALALPGCELMLLHDREAAAHLFAVAGGLESMLLGETQILGQVREAHHLAADAGTTGAVLNRLFTHAVGAGRRIRSETRVAEPTTIPAAAVHLAERALGSLVHASVLVLGAGRMSELVLASLVHRHTGRIVVANRTLGTAQELARRFSASAVPLDQVAGAAATADVVISCTASRGFVLSARDLREEHPLLLVDIAVPRDIDPAVAAIPGCSLYDVDDVAAVVAASRFERAGELERARSIAADEARRFHEWQRSIDVVPAIVSLRTRADEIRAEQLRRAEGKLCRLAPRERRLVESITAQIVNRLLHEPTVRMKQAAAGPSGPAYVGAVEHLFALGEERT